MKFFNEPKPTLLCHTKYSLCMSIMSYHIFILFKLSFCIPLILAPHLYFHTLGIDAMSVEVELIAEETGTNLNVVESDHDHQAQGKLR
jgi:hypothetical protein